MSKSITIDVIPADDFFSTLEKELAEPIPGEEFDRFEAKEPCVDTRNRRDCRPAKRHQAAKPKSKK
jgi:hypothetical protein